MISVHQRGASRRTDRQIDGVRQTDNIRWYYLPMMVWIKNNFADS